MIRMNEKFIIDLRRILQEIQDLKQSLAAAGIDDTDELIRAIRRMVLMAFMNNEITERLAMEE